MRELSRLLAERGIDFDAVDRRIMCFPHILNVCSGHVIDKYLDVEFTVDDEAWVDALDPTVVIEKEAYLKALEEDPIALGRSVVRVVRASSLRRQDFSKTITTGNEMQWFTDEDGQPINLPMLELMRDVKSRWDSVFIMINRLGIMRQVSMLPPIAEHADFFHRHSTVSSELRCTETSLNTSLTKCIGLCWRTWKRFSR